MEKKLSDYLHLYLGCECELQLLPFGETMREVLTGVSVNEKGEMVCYFLNSGESHRTTNTVKPIIRPLTDMTVDESKSVFLIRPTTVYGIPESAELTRYLLSKGFDLFGLIEAGLAIDKTKQS